MVSSPFFSLKYSPAWTQGSLKPRIEDKVFNFALGVRAPNAQRLGGNPCLLSFSFLHSFTPQPTQDGVAGAVKGAGEKMGSGGRQSPRL